MGYLPPASIAEYYDGLAPYYHLIFQDWETSIQSQGDALDCVIREHFGAGVRTVLDAACGIGTQSIALALRGYHVTASDISAAEIERAQAETSRRDLDIHFGAADMRFLHSVYSQPFDLVIACDNAIPHLLSDGEILQALCEFYACTRSGGGCILSVRDYGGMERGGKKLYPRPVHGIPGGNLLLFDLWEFDGDFYDFTTYVVEDRGGKTSQTHILRGGRYYCVTIVVLEKLMAEAGFSRVVTLREAFFQPLILGFKD